MSLSRRPGNARAHRAGVMAARAGRSGGRASLRVSGSAAHRASAEPRHAKLSACATCQATQRGGKPQRGRGGANGNGVRRRDTRGVRRQDTTTGRGGAMGTSRPTATGPHHGARRGGAVVGHDHGARAAGHGAACPRDRITARGGQGNCGNGRIGACVQWLSD